ncbi:condensin-2 complex subunit H2 isoform X2 [Mugil cephalus]|uniref:condensin-2 complex subunit H2 isoform X2 n=1 Tax=Mugil cephalus TaxID=48193 RepID=UPI001FB83D50|nr:condensin-2 complex subunit H2 isoform X2 [Mugil cephalus]
MEATENRFAHLLQPIRELTKNWEIDVASELNDYLEELDEMCITLDGGNIKLNFVEAALLIQGSACIYSKKVELLHNLVYQTLEYINDRNKKRNKQAAAAQEDGGDAGCHDDEEEEFSPLELEASETSERSDANSEVQVVPLPPESLIPPETHEKQKLPLISVKGEVICSLKDFRINLFTPRDLDLILLTSAPPHSHLASLLEEHSTAVDIVYAAGGGGDAVRGGGDAVRGGGDCAEEFVPLGDMEMDVEEEEEEHVDRHQAPGDGPVIRERRGLEGRGLEGRGLEGRGDEGRGLEGRGDVTPPSVKVCPFHDPYAVLGEDRPLKPGKCYRVPDGLDDGGKRKRRRAAGLQDFRSWFRGNLFPAEPKLKNGPSLSDLNYVYLTSLKDKLRTQRRICRKAGVMVSDEELRRTFLQPEEAGPQQQGEEPVEGHADLLGGDEDSDDEHEAFPEEFGQEDVVIPESQRDELRDELSYEELVKLRVDQLVVNSRGYTQETALSRRVKDWEDKIRPELVLQEERPAFDIHVYGERIVGALSGVGHRRPFSSIVQGLDNFEVCKYLLASLQLANDYTVELDCSAGLEEALDSMGLTLLSTQRATDRFKTLTGSS